MIAGVSLKLLNAARLAEILLTKHNAALQHLSPRRLAGLLSLTSKVVSCVSFMSLVALLDSNRMPEIGNHHVRFGRWFVLLSIMTQHREAARSPCRPSRRSNFMPNLTLFLSVMKRLTAYRLSKPSSELFIVPRVINRTFSVVGPGK